MEWKKSIEHLGPTSAIIEQAKVEAQRAIAEQLETLNEKLDLLVQEITKRD